MENLKKKLIDLLVENARYTVKDLSAMLGYDGAVIEKTIKELENEGVIVKYSAIVNTEAMDNTKVQALIEVKVAPQKLNGFDSYAEEIYNFAEVQSLYLMSGGFDLAVFVEGNTLGDISKFIAEKLSVIDGITSVQTHFILKKYKIEGQVARRSEESKRQLIHA